MKFSRHLAQKKREQFVTIVKNVKSIDSLPKAIYGASSRKGKNADFKRMIRSNKKLESKVGILKDTAALERLLPEQSFTIGKIASKIFENVELLNSWHKNQFLSLEEKKTLCRLIFDQKMVCKKKLDRIKTFINRNKDEIIKSIEQLESENEIKLTQADEQGDHYKFDDISINKAQHEDKIRGKRLSDSEVPSSKSRKTCQIAEQHELQCQLDKQSKLLVEIHQSIKEAEETVKHAHTVKSMADKNLKKIQAQLNESKMSKQKAQEIFSKATNEAELFNKNVIRCKTLCSELHHNIQFPQHELQCQLDKQSKLLVEIHQSIKEAEETVKHAHTVKSMADKNLKKIQAQLNESKMSKQKAQEIFSKATNEAELFNKNVIRCKTLCSELHHNIQFPQHELQCQLDKQSKLLVEIHQSIKEAEETVKHAHTVKSMADKNLKKIQAQLNESKMSKQKAQEIFSKATNEAELFNKNVIRCKTLCSELHHNIQFAQHEIQCQLKTKLQLLVEIQQSIKKTEQSVQHAHTVKSMADKDLKQIQAKVMIGEKSMQKTTKDFVKVQEDVKKTYTKVTKLENILEKLVKKIENQRIDFLYNYQSTWNNTVCHDEFVMKQCQDYFGVHSLDQSQIRKRFYELTIKYRKDKDLDDKIRNKYLVVNNFVQKFLVLRVPKVITIE